MSDLRRELHEFLDRLVDAIEQAAPKSEWVDQKESPLGRQRHTALVRAGTLQGVKDGKRVMVRRADIDAYLAKKRVVVKVDERAEVDAEAVRILADMQRRSA